MCDNEDVMSLDNDDLKKVREVATDVFEIGMRKLIQPQFDELNKKFDGMQETQNKILETLDTLAANYTTMVQEEAGGAAVQSKQSKKLEEYGEQLGDHETRIKQVELTLAEA